MNQLSLRDSRIIICIAAGIFILYFLRNFVNLQSTVLILATLFAILLMLISAYKWKFSIYFFLLWFVLEGIFRKWILPEYSTYLFFVKYFILIGPILHFGFKGIHISKKEYPFYGVILIYVFWGILEIANPRVTNDLRVKVLGLMVHFSFIPLLYIIPQFIKSKQDILKLINIVILTSIPILILGVFQYYSPPDNIINKYVAHDAHIARVGQFTRVTGVFTYLTPYVNYLHFLFCSILIMTLIGRISNKMKIILLFSATLCVLNLFMTGSRGAVYVAGIIAISFIGLSILFRIINLKKSILYFTIILLITFSFVFISDVGKDSYSAFIQRSGASGGIANRIIDNFTPYQYFDQAGLFGYGIGTTYQGSSRFIQSYGDMPKYIEEEPERIFLELGLLGFVIVILVRFSLIIYTWNQFKKFKDKDFKIISLLVIIYQIPAALGFYNIVFNTYQAIIYWFLIGLVVAITKIYNQNDKARYYSFSSR